MLVGISDFKPHQEGTSMKKWLISFLLVLSVFGTVYGQENWKFLIEEEGLEIYLDFERMDLDRNRYWFKYRMSKGDNRIKGYYSIELREFDCYDKKYRILQSSYFDKNDHHLRTIRNTKDWEYPIPMSINDGLLEVMCRLK